MIMKKLLTILLLVSMSFTFTSCDSWLDVNKNVDAPYMVCPVHTKEAWEAYEKEHATTPTP